jgi:response regulator RpfG family c-di-GMP phosphodiesterase
MDKKHNILFVDDEEGILSALRRVFRKEDYEIHTCSNPEKALELLEKQQMDLIISDHNMPQMTGTEFLEKASEIQPDTTRILLTGFGDVNIAMDAINSGGIYKFIPKPWNDQDLRVTVKQALKQYLLLTENTRLNNLIREQNQVLKKLNADLENTVQERTVEIKKKNEELLSLNQKLENNFLNAIRVFTGMVELRNSEMGNHSKRVSELARFIADEMCENEEEAKDVETAALLHDIGKIGIPDRVFAKGVRNLTREEQETLKQHPMLGCSVVSSFEGLSRAALFIKHYHEKYDGTGYPDKLAGQNIPLGSRIIAVADRYDLLVSTNRFGASISSAKAMDYITRHANAEFDPEVVQFFVVARQKGQAEVKEEIETEVTVKDLRPGMVISHDMRTVSRRLLLPGNSTITEENLRRIRKYQQYDPVIDGIFIYNPEHASQMSS